MSGTSLDGIDAVLLRVRGHGPLTSFKQLAFFHHPYPTGLKQLFLKNSRPETSSVDEITRLNVLHAHLSADAVKRVAGKGGFPLSRIHLIGSHGQTIHHLPKPVRMFGKQFAATLQIGDPSVLATLTGITTVGEFRLPDMAAGGQGAPLVPFFDWLVFRSPQRNRLLLNIGGIANITMLPRNCTLNQVLAFDTGPGNMVIDALMEKLYGLPMDKNGRIASIGMAHHDVLQWMKEHPFLAQRPPKSTGREMFGESFVRGILRRAKGAGKEDIIATATAFTAFSIFQSYKWFLSRYIEADELIVSGGGSKNRALMKTLRELFVSVMVQSTSDLGVSSEAKEAACFALLANECVAGNPANVPSVTGARRTVILGKICQG